MLTRLSGTNPRMNKEGRELVDLRLSIWLLPEERREIQTILSENKITRQRFYAYLTRLFLGRIPTKMHVNLANTFAMPPLEQKTLIDEMQGYFKSIDEEEDEEDD